jgi:hypothetical protein
MTFADEIEKVADNEPIKGIVLGAREYQYDDDDIPPYQGKLLSWAEARPLLDYDYDSDYGSPDCHPVYVWTKTKVIFVVVYDGSTWLSSVPRTPKAGTPSMKGNG